jgi:hypothetical protein
MVKRRVVVVVVVGLARRSMQPQPRRRRRRRRSSVFPSVSYLEILVESAEKTGARETLDAFSVLAELVDCDIINFHYIV